jgi:hypothetical protein
MTQTFKLERMDGTPAEPASFKNDRARLESRRQDPDLGRPDAPGRPVRNDDELPALVVEDVA